MERGGGKLYYRSKRCARDSEGVCVYVEGVNRKSCILFSFQLLLIDDNEMRLVSRSLRRNQACKYIHVHVHVHGDLQLYTCTVVSILLCCHGNNRFLSLFMYMYTVCHHAGCGTYHSWPFPAPPPSPSADLPSPCLPKVTSPV